MLGLFARQWEGSFQDHLGHCLGQAQTYELFQELALGQGLFLFQTLSVHQFGVKHICVSETHKHKGIEFNWIQHIVKLNFSVCLEWHHTDGAQSLSSYGGKDLGSRKRERWRRGTRRRITQTHPEHTHSQECFYGNAQTNVEQKMQWWSRAQFTRELTMSCRLCMLSIGLFVKW